MVATVRAATLLNYAEVARQVGLNPVRMLRLVDIDLRALAHPDLRIPAANVGALLEVSALESGCETFGLRMAESRQLSDFGALSLLIRHQPTLREVLATLSQYRDLLNETLAIQVEETDRTVIVREDFLIPMPAGGRQAYELAIGVLYRIFRALLGARWQALSVNFTHAAPQDLLVHRRLFGTELVFNSAFNGVVCASDDLDRINPTADPAMAGYARNFVETLPRAGRHTVVGEVQKAIHLLLPAGEASLERVADSVGLGPRSLQRRLADQGAEFRQLLDEVRGDLALRYLKSDAHSLTHIAQMLGYSQISAFTRWFSARFGMSPSAWRKRKN